MGRRYNSKEVREAIAYAIAHGFEMAETSNKAGHIKMRHSTNGALLVFPSTPSTRGWLRSLQGDVRRYAKNGRPYNGNY